MAPILLYVRLPCASFIGQQWVGNASIAEGNAGTVVTVVSLNGWRLGGNV